MKRVAVNIAASVLLSDEEYFALHLDNAMSIQGMAARISSHVGDGPLFEGRESAIRVTVKLDKSQYAQEPVTNWRR